MKGGESFLRELKADLQRSEGARWTAGIWAILIGVPLLSAVIVGVASLSIDHALRNTIATAAEAVLEANQQTIRAEVRDVLRDVRAVCMDPEVAGKVKTMVDGGEGGGAVSAVELLQQVRTGMGRDIRGGTVLGLAITDLSGAILESGLGESTGRLSSVGMLIQGAAMASENGVFRPFVPPVLLTHLGAEPRSMNALFACAFREAENKRPFAVLWVLVDPADPFAAVLTAGEFAQTGETYVFDSRGRMLSRSRFAGAIAQNTIGGVEPGEILLRDPGVDLAKMHSPVPETDWPDVRPVTAVKTGVYSGSDIDGYRNYRGVEVIGGWEWMPEFGIGLIAEMERAEALRMIRPLRVTVAVLSFFAIVSIVMLAVHRLRIKRLRRNIEEIKELGRYRLEGLIGTGGMGKVFKARHALLRRPTAIKMISGWEIDDLTLVRFEREVRHTSRMTHPSTIRIYDFGRTPEGIFYYAMELVDGLTISRLVEISGPQPAARVLHLLEQVAGSLEEAHGEGLVHRDIKPMNIMICCRPVRGDVAKVLDFGLVKDMSGSEPQITKEHQMFGTSPYMAPERIKDSTAANPALDVYSLGSVAFVLLTGEETFTGTSELEVINKVLESDAPRPSMRTKNPIPRELDDLVVRMLQRDPDNRPSSMRDVHQSLLEMVKIHPWSLEQAEASWAQCAFDSIAQAGPLPAGTSTMMDIVVEDRFGDTKEQAE